MMDLAPFPMNSIAPFPPSIEAAWTCRRPAKS